MNFQVLSISFQTLKSGYFIFANNGYVSNEKKKKKKKRVKKNIGDRNFFLKKTVMLKKKKKKKKKMRVKENIGYRNFFPNRKKKDHSTI